MNGAGVPPERVAVWLGPGHIQEFVSGKPNCMVIDSANHSLAIALADWLRSDLIRFYYGNDLIGSEIGGAAKNVMGIAAGMLDGGGYGALKGVLMARGARRSRGSSRRWEETNCPLTACATWATMRRRSFLPTPITALTGRRL